MTAYFTQPDLSATFENFAKPDLLFGSEGARRVRYIAEMVLREDGESVEQIASRAGFSRQHLYNLLHRLEQASLPRRPGPNPTTQQQERQTEANKKLKAENKELRQKLKKVQQERDERLEVTEDLISRINIFTAGHQFPVRPTRELIAFVFGGDKAPRIEKLLAERKQGGRAATRLRLKANGQIENELHTLAGDDVFLASSPVKVITEPESMAVIDLGLSSGVSGKEWELWLGGYPALSLLVSDLGVGLLKAAKDLGIEQSADWNHEQRWWHRDVLVGLLKRVDRALATYWPALDAATRPFGAGRRGSIAAVEAAEAVVEQCEADYFLALEVSETVLSLYQPVNPSTGRLWHEKEIKALLEDSKEKLATISSPFARTARNHIHKHGARFTAYQYRIDAIEVERNEQEGWSRASILNGVLRLSELGRIQAAPAHWVDLATFWQRERLKRSLLARLKRACPNLEAVRTELKREIRRPKRSSSGVESLNNRLRTMQYVHRHLSDELISLWAFCHNLTPRRSPRQTTTASPYNRLGVDIGQADKPWYDLLLGEVKRHRAA